MSLIPARIKNWLSRFAHPNAARDVQAKLLEDMNLQLPEDQPQVRNNVKIPLGERLGFTRLTINEAKVQAAAKAEMGEKYAAPAAPHTVILEHLLEEARLAAAALGIDPAAITKHTVAGKNHLAWFLGLDAGDSIFDLGSARWRIPDWLSPPVEDPVSCDTDFLTPVEAEALGDGVVAVMQPSLLGLDPLMEDFVQMRMFIRNKRGKVVRLFKGIVMLSPDAKNVIAWDDGYGYRKFSPLDSGYSLEMYPMTWGSKANFRARYTEQGLWYQGVIGWWKRFFSLANLFQAVGDEHDRDVDRLLKGNATVRSLAGFGFVTLASRMLQRSTYAGVSRMMLPAKAFAYIHGLEHIAKIEDELAEGDVETGVPYYYAPRNILKRFTAFKDNLGRIRSTLNRRPDLSTGQCTRSHQLKGGQPFNAIVVPSWSMLKSGADFDGDAIVVFPHQAQGGLYVAFNELPLEEQERRLKHATVNRKADKTPYDSVMERHAGQLEAKVLLGAADLAARRFLDADMPEAAWAMQPWIQWTVDRQKRRGGAAPHPAGPAHMPKPPSKNRDGDRLVYLTDVLRDISKSEDAEAGASDYRKALANIESRLAALRAASGVAASDWQANELFVRSSNELAEYALRWCMETDWRLDSAQLQISRRYDRIEKDHIMVPFEGRYPVRTRDPLEELPEALTKLVQTAHMLDEHWDELIRAYDQKTTRSGAFAAKDGLLDALRSISADRDNHDVRELVAGQVTNYNLFRELATPRQLKAYFDQHAADELRISDVTCLNTPDMWDRRSSNEGMSVRNIQPMWIGFERFAPGSLRLSRRKGDNGIVVHVKGKSGMTAPLSTNCRTVGDALIELRAHLADGYDRFDQVADRLQLPVQPRRRAADPMVAKPQAPQVPANSGSGFQVKGEEAFLEALNAA